jgi:hypothetical protein
MIARSIRFARNAAKAGSAESRFNGGGVRQQHAVPPRMAPLNAAAAA